jgi:hypothetical protein
MTLILMPLRTRARHDDERTVEITFVLLTSALVWGGVLAVVRLLSRSPTLTSSAVWWPLSRGASALAGVAVVVAAGRHLARFEKRLRSQDERKS